MKRCRDCGVEKPVEAFYARKGGDGRASYCKKCHLARNKKWSEDNKEHHRDLVRSWEKANRGTVAAYKRQERKAEPERVKRREEEARVRHPEKFAARSKLKLAVFKGHIQKPDICEDCGEAFEVRLIQGHHDDYSRPLDVAWLCKGCHDARHRELVT